MANKCWQEVSRAKSQILYSWIPNDYSLSDMTLLKNISLAKKSP